MESWVFGVGLAAGGLFVVSVCVVWLTKQTFGTGGAVMSFAGVLLVGLSVFKTANIGVTSDGVSINFDLQQVAEDAVTISNELQTLSAAVQANKEGLMDVLARLEEEKVVDPATVASLRKPLETAPRLDTSRLNQASSRLAEISVRAADRAGLDKRGDKPRPPAGGEGRP